MKPLSPLNTLLGYIKGKLSISHQDALQFFNFNMKHNSKGLIFKVRKGKQIILNWLPTSSYKPSPQQKIANLKFKTLTYIASKIRKPIIWKIWNPIAQNQSLPQLPLRSNNTYPGSRGFRGDPDEVGISARKGLSGRGRLPDRVSPLPLTIMAYYTGSILGEIRGKIGVLVFQRYRRKRIIRKWVNTPPSRSIPLKNSRTLFALLKFIAHYKLRNLMWQAWEPFSKSTKVKPGKALFLHRNLPPLYHSIPNKNKPISKSNMPDLSLMIISDGRLEPAPIITNSSYNPNTGELTISWKPTFWGNASPHDYACISAIFFKPKNTLIRNHRSLRFPFKYNAWSSITNYTRINSTALIKIDKKIDPNFLCAFLSFARPINKSKRKIFSISFPTRPKPVD